MTAVHECDCLTADDSSLLHYVSCAEATKHSRVDDSDVRCLAELAAMRDIDVALHCLRNITSKKASKK